MIAEMKKIPCAFCQGKGVDPYHQLSSRSRCEVCQGKKWVVVPEPGTLCGYCQGTGSHKTFSCLVCKGTGVLKALGGPSQVCPTCEGRTFLHSNGLDCLTCKGYGRIPQKICVMKKEKEPVNKQKGKKS